MPKSTPFLAIAVTMLLPATPCAASSMLLHAAMEMFRKKWSLPAMNSITDAASAALAEDLRSAGTRRRMSSDDAATLRLCTSSPMWSACAMSGFNSISFRTSKAALRVGPRVFCIHPKRDSTSGPLAPKRSTLPRPSFRLLKARLPWVEFATIHTGIDGLMIPDIGPTAAWWWQGSKASSPDSASSRAASASSAQPS
jgi:hypothetical protein